MLSTTELYQMLKIPILIEHFFEHKSQNSALSFRDFMTIHYNGNHLENHPHNDDYEQDQKLPFMAHTNAPNFCFVPTTPSQFDLKDRLYQYLKRKMPVLDEHYTGNNFLSSIWQPPRFC